MAKTLHSLIKTTNWKQVEECMTEYYPDEETSYYKRLFWTLSNIEPVPNDSGITLDLDMFEEDEDEVDGGQSDGFDYYEVEYPHEISNEQWAFYLGFEIDDSTLKKLPQAEIICHLFFEFLYGEIESILS